MPDTTDYGISLLPERPASIPAAVNNSLQDVDGNLFRRPSVATMAQITADQNNYALADAAICRVSSDATRTITGIVAPTLGEIRTLVNVGAENIVLAHADSDSTAANRFKIKSGVDVTLEPDGTVMLWYDLTTQRWRVLARP